MARDILIIALTLVGITAILVSVFLVMEYRKKEKSGDDDDDDNKNKESN